MTPMARVATGFLMVVVDLRIGGLDLVPDVVGWLLVVAGLVPLARRHEWFAAAAAAAVLGAIVSVPLFVGEPGPAVSMLTTGVETAMVFGTCSGIRAVVGRESVTRTADGIRWLDLTLTAVLLAIGVAVGFRQVESLAAIPLAILGLGVLVWFLLFLLRVREDPTLQDRQYAVG